VRPLNDTEFHGRLISEGGSGSSNFGSSSLLSAAESADNQKPLDTKAKAEYSIRISFEVVESAMGLMVDGTRSIDHHLDKQ
jgi:hypothetical protein